MAGTFAATASRPRQFLAVTSALLLLLIMGVNQWAQVFAPTRARYLSALWPAALLLVSLALLHLSRPTLRLPVGIVLILAMAIAGVSDFLQGGPLVRSSWAWRGNNISAATMRRALQDTTNETLLVMDYGLVGPGRQSDLYVSAFDGNSLSLYPDTSPQELQKLVQETSVSHEVVLLLRSSREPDFHLQDHVDLFLQRQWIQHQTWRDDRITLVRFVTPYSRLLAEGR